MTVDLLPPCPAAFDAVSDVIGMRPGEQVVRVHAQRHVACVPNDLAGGKGLAGGLLVDPSVHQDVPAADLEATVGEEAALIDYDRSGPKVTPGLVSIPLNLLPEAGKGRHAARNPAAGERAVAAQASIMWLTQVQRWDRRRAEAIDNRAHRYTLVQEAP